MAFVDLKTAIGLLKASEVVALPTETVYGLAGRIDSASALNKIFETKKRPFFDPLIVHISLSMDPLNWVTEWPEVYVVLAEKFWPGPLTLIAEKRPTVSDLITSGLSEVALRSPNHPLFQEVLNRLGVPLAAPSANMFGRTSPTRAEHVEVEFSGSVPVLDGGDCQVGVESTVVRFDKILGRLEILRPGLISTVDLKKATSRFSVEVVETRSPVAPGQLKNHYQPKAPVVLIYTSKPDSQPEPNLISEIQRKLPSPLSEPTSEFKILNLKASPIEIARRLYSDLRELSESSPPFILAVVNSGSKTDPAWTMILDRLEKASTLTLNI